MPVRVVAERLNFSVDCSHLNLLVQERKRVTVQVGGVLCFCLTVPLLMANLVQIRRMCRHKRRSLSGFEQLEHSRRVVKLIQHSRWLWRARRIAVYLAMDGELDLTPLITALRRVHKRLYLPVLRSLPQHKLWFAHYTPNMAMRPNRFNILEPYLGQFDRRSPRALDVILVPLVAFDANGHRLGMGGGFYDRTFAYRGRDNAWQRPHLIGVAHECQRVESIPSRPWDIAMDMIITERCIYPT